MSSGERGASAILVAFLTFLLFGIAAVAVDMGFGLNERRSDVGSADTGVMAGAVETLGTTAQIRDQILAFTRLNLETAYADAQWQALWESCVDSEKVSLNASGYQFVSVVAPGGWAVTQLDCISVDPAGYVRVRVPDQEVDTTFARVLGFLNLTTHADAIARWHGRLEGGILPFGILGASGEGEHVCLRDNSGGQAEPPCDGPDAGNFGALESPLYGNQDLGTTQNCTASPKSDVLAINIALGLDHRVIPDADGLAANEVLDTCNQIDAGYTPDTINAFQGLSTGMPEGIATGPVPGGFEPRLQQGPNPKKNVHSNQLDDKPVWEYFDAGLAAPSIPELCEAWTFDDDNILNVPFDWDGDGTLDQPESWEHAVACFQAYVDGGYTAQLLTPGIKNSPRFGYVPQFWEVAWPSGNSEYRHISKFKAAWLQGTWWKRGNDIDVHYPGEGGTFPGGNWALRQLSALVLPDTALPIELRGDPPPWGGLNPYVPELYR